MMKRATVVFSVGSPLRLAALALVALIGFAGAARQAAAQGTMGTVPDPISTRELDGYATRLKLSDQQRMAVDSFHDQYKLEYAALRDSDIEKLVNSAPNMRGPMALMADRKEVEKSLKDLDSVSDKIKGIDNRLFDQIQTVLAEDQIAALQGVRQARERVRDRSGLTRMTSFMNPAVQVDLTEILAGMQLSPQERELVDPMIAQYEASLTSAIRKLHEGGAGMVLEMMDKLNAQGINAAAAADPAKRDQMFSAFRTVFAEVNGKMQEKATAVSELNLKTQRSLVPVLSAEHARTLRDDFVDRAYSEAARGGGQTAKAFDLALKFKELTDEQRQAVAALASEFHGAFDHSVDQSIALVDQNRQTGNFMDNNRDQRQKYDDEMRELRDKRRALATSSLESLKASLGPDLAERLDKRLASGGSDGEPGVMTFTVSGVGGAGSVGAIQLTAKVAADEVPAKDPFIPDAISHRNIDTYAVILGLDDDNKTILSSMHDDYLEKFKVIESTDIKAAREAEGNQWSMGGRGGPGGDIAPPTEQSVEALYSLRSRALAAILALDAAFFGDVRTALLTKEQEPLMQRVISLRQRDVYNRGNGNALFNFGGGGRRGGGGPGGPGGPGAPGGQGGRGGPGGGGPGGRAFRNFGGGASEEGSVDLGDIYSEAVPALPDRTQPDAIISEYETTLTAAFQKKYETAFKLQLARDKMIAKASAESGGGRGPGRNFQGFGGFRDLMDNEGKISREAANAVIALNRETVKRLVAVLPDDAGQNLRGAYNRRAFPSIYRDPRSADMRLTAALNLPDLNDQQRAQVQDIAAEYRAQYNALCDKLVELEANQPDISAMFGGGGPGGGAGGQPNWQAMQEQMRTREKVDFERNDLSDKATSRLKSVLSPEQAQRIGGLDLAADSAN